MLKAVFFDLDETLTDSREAILDWWRGYFECLGRPFLPPQVQHVLYTLPQEHVVPALCPGAEAEEAYARYLALVGVGNTVTGVALKTGARDVLAHCSARFALALGTNRSSGLNALLRHLGIAEFFDVIVSGETAPHFKPHPWGVSHVLDRLSLSRTEVVFVGDSPADIEFAANGGIRSVGLGENWKRGPLAPTWAIDDIVELTALLDRIAAAE